MSEEVAVCDEHCLCQRDCDLIVREDEDHVSSRARQVLDTVTVHPDAMEVEVTEEEEEAGDGEDNGEEEVVPDPTDPDGEDSDSDTEEE